MKEKIRMNKLLHKEIFDLLCEIDEICKENNIQYYLIAGSVIGAVRHKKFIPWDDDADVAMTEDNWEKFKLAINNRQLKNRILVTRDKYPDFRFTYPQYKNTKTCLIFRSGVLVDYPLGTFIDILILDPVKNNKKYLERHFDNLKLLGELMAKSYVLNRTTNLWKYNFCLILSKFINREYILNYLENSLKKTTKDDCDGYAQRVAVYSVYIDKKFLKEPEYFYLYGRRFPTPTNTYEYLRYTYGDTWMYYPDNVNLEGHGFSYDVDFSYDIIKKDYEKYIDKKQYEQAWKKFKKWRLKAVKSEDIIEKINLKREAAVYSLKVEKDFQNIDVINLLEKNKFIELGKLFKYYYEKQLSNKFIRNKIYINVSLKIFYVACIYLIFKGEYYKASKILNCYSHFKNKEIYKRINSVIELSRELSIAYYEEHENWEHLNAIIEKYLPTYPVHADLNYYKCWLLINNDKLNEAKNRCLKILKLYPDNYDFIYLLANILYKLNNKDEAAQLYQNAYENTQNGMLRLKIEEETGDRNINLHDNVNKLSEKTFEEEYYQKNVQKAQTKILKLMQEIDEICNKENINYFLGGYLAAEAVELNDFAPECCSAYIVMHPADRKRFIKAVNKSLLTNRILESYESNSNYADFSLRYCDISSVVFDKRTEGFYNYHALNITIYFVRPYLKNKFLNKFNSGLYAAIEANAFSKFYYNSSRKKSIAGFFAWLVFLILGKRNVKTLAWKLIYQPENVDPEIRGSIKSYWLKPINLPKLQFDKFQYIELRNCSFRIPINYDEYIQPQIKSSWNNGNPVDMLLKNNIIAEFDIYSKAFSDRLKDLNLKNKYFKYWQKLVRYNNVCNKESWYGFNYAWYIAMRSVERLKLWKKYAPKKEQIMKLYKEERYHELELLLEEYITALKRNIVNKQTIIFDAEIFRITWAVLEKTKQIDLITKLLSNIPAEHLMPIKLTCGRVSFMKKADVSDKQKILSYLEKEIANCLYIYADICKYGFDKPYLNVWYDEDNLGIRMVVMQYHNSFQIYSNRGFDDIENVKNLIIDKKPYGISARKEIVQELDKQLNDKYSSEYGVIFKGKEIDKQKLKVLLDECNEEILLAKSSDAEQIADLLCLDDEMGIIYTRDSLREEIKERIETGMGRSYIIKKDGIVIAHNATFAESSKFVIVGGLMVHPDYRDKEYFYWLDLKSSLEFQMENKDRYFFILDPKLKKLHKKLGNEIIAEYGKLALIEKY